MPDQNEPCLTSPRISIITPWRDHLELEDDYFEAVLPEMEEGDELIILDNASDPPLLFGTIRSETNLGFARGSNLGLRAAKCQAVLMLNNDVALGRRGWLEQIRKAIEPGVLCGPIRYDHHADVDGTSFPYVDGWALCGWRDDLLALGGFDETLQEPSYFSDNVLSLEARIAGMTLREVRVGLVHKENVTAGRADSPAVRAASEANRAVYLGRARSVLAAV